MLVGLRIRLALWRKEEQAGRWRCVDKDKFIVHTLPLLLESYIKVVEGSFRVGSVASFLITNLVVIHRSLKGEKTSIAFVHVKDTYVGYGR